MSQPHGLALNAHLLVAGRAAIVHFINTGVPHAVVSVEDLSKIDIRAMGSSIRYHDHFAPKGTNANFIQPLGPSTLAIRTYERGVEDETLACGTGVVASALIYNQLHNAPSPVGVKVKGGDILEVGFEREGNEYRNVTLNGPADFVFDGQSAL
jgi:diaminopimelate epimerase